VIVIQKGQIVAAGTPLRIKSKHGKGYRFTVNSDARPVRTRPPVASARLRSYAPGQVVWSIENAADLNSVVSWADEMEHNTRLRRSKEETGWEEGHVSIQGWEINMPSLEDVLLEEKLF
jgi:ABC-type multidrug transport system ATPase subunit